MPDQPAPKTLDEYIARYPREVQEILEKIRVTIRNAAPEAEETIKYQMPTFTLHGNLVYFGAFKNHIGFYPPISSGSEAFRQEVAKYEGPKRSLIFPFDQPIPYHLIDAIVRLRVLENLARVKASETKR